MNEKMAEAFRSALELDIALDDEWMREEPPQGPPLPGISAAVILPDGRTWLGVRGKSSDTEAVTSDMLFGLASVTKTYVAALVAQLAEEGALSVEDPVGKWIPDLGQIDGDITIRQLLHHTSGLYPYQQSPEFLEAIYAQPERVWTPQEIVQRFQGEPRPLPESDFAESAMDYVLLGMILEKATGTSVVQQLTERFFAPLNLDHTFLYPEQTYPTEKMAHMWWDVTGEGEPVDVIEGTEDLPLAALFSGLWTAGAMHATAEDLARFVKELFEGRVIDEGALAAMLAPGPELSERAHYGYSVIVEQVEEKTAYWHPGGAGYASIYFYQPAECLSIAALGNRMDDLLPVAAGLRLAYLSHAD